MKRTIFLFAVCVMMSLVCFAQGTEPDSLVVGPYKVDYFGPGDYYFKLAMDPVEFYHFKKDTVVNVIARQRPTLLTVKNAFQIDLFMAVPRYVVMGASNVFGLEGSWKLGLSPSIHFSAGLSAAIRMGKYHKDSFKASANPVDTNGKSLETEGYTNEFKETVIELGVPLMVEFGKIDREKASLFAGFGVVPTYYMGTKGEHNGQNAVEIGKSEDPVYADKPIFGFKDEDSKSGLYVAPRVEIGGYIPVDGRLFRIGAFYQNNINCSAGDYDVYKNRIGRGHVGAKVGLVF